MVVDIDLTCYLSKSKGVASVYTFLVKPGHLVVTFPLDDLYFSLY